MRSSGRVTLLILSISILSYGFSGLSFAQDVTPSTIPPLSVEPDQELYAQGNTVTISGQIRTLAEYAQDVSIVVRDPTGNVVSIDQISPNADGTYTLSFKSDGPLWKEGGDYTVLVQYGGQKAEATFTFAGGSGIAPPPPPPPPPPPDV